MPDLLLELRSEEIPALPRDRRAAGARTRIKMKACGRSFLDA